MAIFRLSCGYATWAFAGRSGENAPATRRYRHVEGFANIKLSMFLFAPFLSTVKRCGGGFGLLVYSNPLCVFSNIAVD